MRIRILASVMVLAAAGSVRAQVLADRAPADAVFYAGGVGADAIAAADGGTHLKGILDHSDLPAVVDQFLPQVLDKIGVAAPDSAQAMKLVDEIIPPIWHHPHAFIFDGVNERQHMPKIALLCQAGPDADKLQSAIEDAIKQAQSPVKLQVARDGDLVALSVGFSKPDDAITAAGAAESLATQPNFKDAMAQVDAKGLSAIYVDVPALFKLIDALPDDAQQVKQMAPMVISALGLDGVKSIALSQNFDGKDWTQKAFLGAPAPRRGLLSLVGMPLDQSILKLAPDTSTRVIADNFDVAKLLPVAREAAGKIDPDWTKMIDQMTDQANQTTGVNLQDDLLASFGPDWLAYTDPETAGESSLGVVVVNHPRDSAKLEAALGKLEQFANSMSSTFLSDKHVDVEFRKTTIDGASIHYLAIPLLEPAWTIKDGVWYFAMYPSVVSTAVDGIPGGKSILDHPGFAALAGRLGHAADASGVQYLDIPKLAPESYAGWLLLSRVAGAGDLIGAPAPVTILPKYRDLMADLTPFGAVSWADAAGFHAQSIEAFPLSSLFGSEGLSLSSLSSQATSFSALLPALTKARGQANRVKSMSNLRQIGLGAIMYANDHKGSLPTTLGELAKSEDLAASVFVNPNSNTSSPEGLTKDQLADWVDHHSDYIWQGNGQKLSQINDPASSVLAYENPQGSTEGVNALFADGHVEFLSPYVARQKIPNFPGGASTPHEAPEPKGGGL